MAILRIFKRRSCPSVESANWSAPPGRRLQSVLLCRTIHLKRGKSVLNRLSVFYARPLSGSRRHGRGSVWWKMLICAAAVALAGCGGGGGTGTPPASPGTISGRVVTSAASGSSAPAQGLSVSVDGAPTTAPAPVKPDGSFSLPGVPPGSYTLSVKNGDGSLAGHAVVNVSAGMSTATILELLPAGQISGIVSQRDSSGNLTPVAGLTVKLDSASPEEPPLPIFNPGVNPSTVTPVLEGQTAASGVTSTGSGTGVSSSPIIGAPPPGGPPPPVPPGVPPATMPLSLTTTTASNGTYSFTGVPAGLYSLSSSQGSLSASTFVSVSPAQTAAGDLILAAPVSTTPIQVSGVVTGIDASGQIHPLANALIQFEVEPTAVTGGGGGAAIRSREAQPTLPNFIGAPLPIAGNVGGASASGAPAILPFGVTTDSSGHYSWTIPAGVTTLIATAQGYLPGKGTVSPDATGKAEVDFQLNVDPAASLTATLSVDGFGTGPISIAPGVPLKATLTLSNPSASPVNVYLTGVGEDLLVLDPSHGNGLVWSLNFGKLVPDLAEVEKIPPGSSLTAHVTWPGVDNNGLPLPDGTYAIQGSIAGVTAAPVSFTVAGAPSSTPPAPPNQSGPQPPTIAPMPPTGGGVGSGVSGSGTSGPGSKTNG